jgi:hypothetical protein
MKQFLLSVTLLAGLSAVAQTPRMSLYEEFTGETCPPCAATNPGLNAILLSPTNAQKIIPLKWQVPIPSAPSNTWSLYKTNKAEIDWRHLGWNGGYSSSTINPPNATAYGYPSQNSASGGMTSGVNSAPSGRIDGQHQWVFGASSDHPANLTNAVIATAQSYTSAFSVTMMHEWDAAMSAVVVTVNITASANFTAVGPLVFRCVMVERLIQFSVQPGTNGEKKFEDVVIKSYPNIQNGTPMASTWTIGQTQSFVLNCPVPSYVRKVEEISMVGFIQDDGNRKVAQATRSKATYDAVALGSSVKPVCSANFSPVVTVGNEGLNPITSMTITPYVDGAAQTNVTWTGNLAVGASTTVTMNSVSAPSTRGSHTFSYTIVGINGNEFNVANNSTNVNFHVATGATGNNVVEGFALGLYPPTGWTNVNAAGVTFSRTTQAGGYWIAPMESVKYDAFSNSALGDVDELYLPGMDLRGGDAVEMSFDYAYAQRTSTSNEKLEVKVSTDCGNTWTTAWSRAGSVLATTSPVAFAFIPDQNVDLSAWQTIQVMIPGANMQSVVVKFVVTNDNGNNIYIDNVNLVQKNPMGIAVSNKGSNSLSAYPNPASGEATINFSSNSSGKAGIKVINTLGQVMYNGQKEVEGGDNAITLDLKSFAAGVYYITVEKDGEKHTTSLSVLK